MKNIFNILRDISSRNFIILLAFYFLVFLNNTLWIRIFSEFQRIESIYSVFFLTVPILLFFGFIIIFSITIIKYVTKPLFTFLVITSAMVNYGSQTYGIMFNSEMMVNIFETTSSEATAYLNISSITHVLLTGLLPAIYIIFVNIKYRPLPKELLERFILILVSLLCIVLIAVFFYKDYASFIRNNPKIQKNIVPTYFVGNVYKYFNDKYFAIKLPYVKIAKDASHPPLSNGDKYLFVVVVGETARADNYSLNGYFKETNAYTNKIKNLAYFKNVTSCGTATAVSLPCMFSNLTKDGFDITKFNSRDNVIDVLKHAGYYQAWLDNNTGCKQVCNHIPTFSNIEYSKKYCAGEECKDKILLKMLDDAIVEAKDKDIILYLHLIGSHGPAYFLRYPRKFAKFLPDCQTSDLTACTQKEIVNSYDNTILYSDYIVSKIIKKLEKYQNYHTAMIYLSDHGESLGENGLYLHGMPYAIAPSQQTHIPLIMWLSDRYINDKKIDFECLKKVATTKDFSHDNFFHTLLDLADIKTGDTAYNVKKSLLHHCEHH